MGKESLFKVIICWLQWGWWKSDHFNAFILKEEATNGLSHYCKVAQMREQNRPLCCWGIRRKTTVGVRSRLRRWRKEREMKTEMCEVKLWITTGDYPHMNFLCVNFSIFQCFHVFVWVCVCNGLRWCGIDKTACVWKFLVTASDSMRDKSGQWTQQSTLTQFL